MAAAPMAEAAVVVAAVVVVIAPNVVIVQSATPRALRPVANALHAASVQNVVNAMWNNAVKVVAARVAAKAAAHAKTATAVDAAKAEMVKPVTPKAKLPSTTTLHPKPKPKHAPKHATNAWPAKSVAKAPKAAMSHAKLAVNAQNAVNVMKVAKAVANAAHAVNATTVAVNAPLAWTKTATQKPCHSTQLLTPKAKHRKPTKTVASVVSAVHATVTAVTAVSVATAHRVKKVLQNTPTTAKLLSTTTQRMTTRQTSKPHKKPASHVNHVSHANPVNHAVNVLSALSVQTAHHATRRVKKCNHQHLWPKPQPPLACHAFKASHCL